MGEIIKTDSGDYRAIDNEGNELDNSPYDKEKDAKIALNRSAVKYDPGDSDQEEEEENEEPQEDEKEEENNSSSFGVPVKIGVTALAVVLFLNWVASSESQEDDTEEVEQEEAEEEENQEDDQDDSRASAEDLF